MKKYLLCVLVMAVFATAAWGEECRLLGIVGQSNGNITSEAATAYLDLLQTAAEYNGPDGWGLSYYQNGSSSTGTGTIWYHNGTTDTAANRYASWQSANTDPNYAALKISITSGISSGTIHWHGIVAHIRDATDGNPNYIPDPHPFIYEQDGHSYSLAFNGSVSNDMLTFMRAQIDSLQQSQGWNDSQLTALRNSTVDSGVYCGYLMSYVRYYGWDIMRGVKRAQTRITQRCNTSNDFTRNFILSDGYDLYGYRFASAADSVSADPHYLGYKNSIYSAGVIAGSIGQSSFVSMDNDEFVCLSTSNPPVIMKKFSQRLVRWIKTFKDIPSGTTNGLWSWDSFPVLNPDMTAVQTMYQHSNEGGSGYGFDTADYVRAYLSEYYLYKNYTSWIQHNLSNFTQVDGYKIHVTANDPTPARVRGKIVGTDATFTLQPDHPNWVGYWLLNSQSLVQALGNSLSKIASVQAQDWSYTYNPLGTQTGDQPMEFGKMYIITLRSNVTTPVTFQWTNCRAPQSQIVVAAAENLVVQANSATYEAIDVASVADSTNVEEIGVYAGDTCLGASKVISYPVQIIAYTEGYEGEDLTFRYYTGQRSAVQGEAVSSIYDAQSEAYESGALTARPGAYRVVTLGANELTPAAAPTPALHVSTAPNPFNPSTVIALSLPKDAPVEVSIYNLRGQRVCQLAKGQYTAGTYRLTWNGTSDNGHATASGIYFCRVQAGSSVATCKMIMMK